MDIYEYTPQQREKKRRINEIHSEAMNERALVRFLSYLCEICLLGILYVHFMFTHNLFGC